jgi:hypothetical protein
MRTLGVENRPHAAEAGSRKRLAVEPSGRATMNFRYFF